MHSEEFGKFCLAAGNWTGLNMATSMAVSQIEEIAGFAKSGNRLLAEYHLRKLMQDSHEPIEDPAVWMMLAWLSASPLAMKQVLEQFLAIDPHHELARLGVQWAQGLADLVVEPQPEHEDRYDSIEMTCNGSELHFVPLAFDSTEFNDPSSEQDPVELVVQDVQQAYGTPASNAISSTLKSGDTKNSPPQEDLFDKLFHSRPVQAEPHQAEIARPHIEVAAVEQVDIPGLTEATSNELATPEVISTEPVSTELAETDCDSAILVVPTEDSSSDVVTDRPEDLKMDLRATAFEPASNPDTEDASEITSLSEMQELASSLLNSSTRTTESESVTAFTATMESLTANPSSHEPPASVDATTAARQTWEVGGNELQVQTHSEVSPAASDDVFTDPSSIHSTAVLTIEEPKISEASSLSTNSLEIGSGSTGDDAPSDSNGKGRPTGLSVLVVDDSPTVRKLLAMMLNQSGYQVTTAVDGLDAVQSIAVHAPQLIITDINMPRLDGYKLCKLVTRNARTKHIPVVMISAGIIDRLRGKLAGCSGYLLKPITPGSLNAVVEFALQGSTMHLHSS